MSNVDHQARSNVLKKLILAMGDQMANRTPHPGKTLHVEIKNGGSIESPPDAVEECPHCDGEGCRHCR